MALVLIILDQNVGQVRLTNGDRKAKVLGIDLFPHFLAHLRELERNDPEIALMAPIGRDAAFEWRLGGNKPIRVIGLGNHLGDTLKSAEKHLARSAKDALFVAADRRQRGQARSIGLRPHPHILPAAWTLRGNQALFVHLEGPLDRLERLPECLPYRLDVTETHARLFALMTREGLAAAVTRNLVAHVLAADPALDDVLLVRLDEPQTRQPALAKARVLAVREDTAWLALGTNDSADDLDLHGAHGHYQALAPNPAVFDAPARPYSDAKLAALLRRWPIKDLVAERIDIGRLDLDLTLWTCPTSAAALEDDVRRYTGSTDPGGGPIHSRHSRHPDNARAVNLLVADLTAMGYCAQKFAFSHDGRTLHNVIADLPGRGTLRIKPDWRDRLREIFRRFPPWPPLPDPPWRKEVETLLGREAFGAMARLDPEALRLRLEDLFDLTAWHHWWLRCPLAGVGAELVLLGCHLDSTAASDGGFDPTTDAAPGVDDDASGISVTLAIARALAGRAGQFRHTIRFCFFNAEEQGLAGSSAYAAHLKAHGAPVRAVICSDMVGFNSDANRIFEIHAGYTDAAVRDLSVPIAQRIADWSATLGIPGPAQIYRGTASSGGTDRNLVDGAINRSDHAAFHQQSYPAVVVSEDFFANLGGEPGADPNPNYHRAADVTMDFDYAADIACVIAQAVKELAQ